MCLALEPQRSDAGEARARGPSVSSQALYHWATALPFSGHGQIYFKKRRHKKMFCEQHNEQVLCSGYIVRIIMV